MTKPDNQMLTVTLSENTFISDRFPYINQRVVSVLEVIIGRLQKVLGVKFFLGVGPRPGPQFNDVMIKVNNLSKASIKVYYHIMQNSYHDEPRINMVKMRLGDPHHSDFGFGRSLYGEDECWGPAYGEALERWCINNFDPPPETKRLLTTQELRDLSSLDLFTLPGMDSVSRATAEAKVDYQINSESNFICTLVDELTTGSKQYVPLQLFSFKHARDFLRTHKEPQIQPIISTGAATGRTREEALLGGIYECIERDAFSIYWLRKITPQRLSLDWADKKDEDKISSISDRYGLEYYFLYLKTDFPVHTVLCVVLDRSGVGPAVVVDASTGTDISNCIRKSFLGAIGQREYSRQNRTKFPEESLDERKLTIVNRTFWWYTPDKIKHLDFILNGPWLDTLPKYEHNSKEEELNSVVNSFRNKGYKIYCANILPRELAREINEKVFFIKIPQLMPMHLNEWEKTMVGERLLKLPESLGLSGNQGSINNVPHPFS